MSVIFLFPGQGAQYPGMLAALPDSQPVRETLAQATEVLGCDVMQYDTAAALEQTDAVQIALTISGVSAARHLAAEGATPEAVLGLSIGAWPAAVVAGVLKFEDAVSLVAERGHLMGAAYPQGFGMAAIIGLDQARVEALLAAVEHDGRDRPYLANVNADRQIVVAGSDAALEKITAAAQEAGGGRVIRLDMAVPSHCALMNSPAARLHRAVMDIEFRAPQIAYFSANRKRRLWSAADLRDDLAYNMARTVYWADTARIAVESGFSLALEMPPGHTLTGLHPATDLPSEAVAIDTTGWRNAAALIARATASK